MFVRWVTDDELREIHSGTLYGGRKIVDAEDLAEAIERRDRTRARFESLRPTPRRRAPRHNPERGRAVLIADGERVLEQPNKMERKRTHTMIVRIYYRSEGGELLAFDCGPMSVNAAEELEREHLEIPKLHGGKARWCPSDAVAVERFPAADIGADAQAQGRARKPSHGARLVRLPSQQREQPQEIQEEIPGLM
jgi:hypothetical protein